MEKNFMEIEKHSKALDEMRDNSIFSQKRGIHFILASVLIWGLILFVQNLGLESKKENLVCFFCFALLLPLAFIIAKLLRIDFQNKENPLTTLGILFTVNQLLYLLIAMWVFSVVPEKMLMIVAIIFGGHLLPYSWLYKSKVYLVFAILIPVISFIVGMIYDVQTLIFLMILIEILFAISLHKENIKYMKTWNF